MQGRFGKQLLGKMLGGSQAKEITKLRLDRLSTFGMLGKLLQPELFALVTPCSKSACWSKWRSSDSAR